MFWLLFEESDKKEVLINERTRWKKIENTNLTPTIHYIRYEIFLLSLHNIFFLTISLRKEKSLIKLK